MTDHPYNRVVKPDFELEDGYFWSITDWPFLSGVLLEVKLRKKTWYGSKKIGSCTAIVEPDVSESIKNINSAMRIILKKQKEEKQREDTYATMKRTYIREYPSKRNRK